MPIPDSRQTHPGLSQTRTDDTKQTGKVKPGEPVEQGNSGKQQRSDTSVKPQRFTQQDAQKGILTDADPDDPASP